MDIDSSLLHNVKFFWFLFKIDQHIFEEQLRGKCRFCGSKLHMGSYKRKPRGIPKALEGDDRWCQRFSCCCSNEGCRKRHTPVSMRFMGRRVYNSTVFIFICAMRSGDSEYRSKRLAESLGINRRTLRRWRKWWKEWFPTSKFWKKNKSQVSEEVNALCLPVSLLEVFKFSFPLNLLYCQSFLLPLTGFSADIGRLKKEEITPLIKGYQFPA